MELDNDTNKQIEELQAIDSTLQNFLAQKQTAEIEVNELMNAIEEINKTDDDAYKIVAGIMIKADKKILLADLEEKKKMLDMKIQAVEKQEDLLGAKATELKKEIDDAVSKKSEAD